MIYESLTCVNDRLNSYFSNRFSLSEQKVMMSNLVNQDGTVAVRETDKLILTMLNLQKENLGSGMNKSGGVYTNKPVNVNVYILFSAYFSENNYKEGLKFISALIGFFQGNPVFTRENTPDLDDKISKLTFELENLSLQDLNHIWGMLGGKYLPSVVYKMRMITIQEGDITGTFSNLSSVGNNFMR